MNATPNWVLLCSAALFGLGGLCSRRLLAWAGSLRPVAPFVQWVLPEAPKASTGVHPPAAPWVKPFLAPAHRGPPPSPGSGLSSREVQARVERGLTNAYQEPSSRSVWNILRANVFTRFNAILGSLLLVILWVGPLQDALFGISIVVNSLVGLTQELQAKRALDRLAVVSRSPVHVVREGALQEVAPEQLVQDDVVELRAGDEVPVDGTLVSAEGLELDESLLTGESRPIAKRPGDPVLSGTVVVAGGARLLSTQVGARAYGHRLSAAARTFGLARSELRAGIDSILAVMVWVLLPTAAILAFSQLVHPEAGWRDALRGTVAALEGMVPQGLVLLTSVALALSVVRLARHRVLIQELAAVEVLARVDVLCVDKTGTLTTGCIALETILPLGPPGGTEAPSEAELHAALGCLARADAAPNASARAVAERCPRPLPDGWRVVHAVPFSSERRWSGVATRAHGSWLLGSPEALLAEDSSVRARVEQLTCRGKRVLLLARARADLGGAALPEGVEAAALVVLVEEIRPDAAVTLRYFAEQGVAIKVISGDDCQTVAEVARRAGVTGAGSTWSGVDLPEEPSRLAEVVAAHTVFGHVGPHQKQAMVSAVRGQGHVVAMMGDGINDLLALKVADLGIAAEGAAAAVKAVAKVVAGSGFECLPQVVAEGRRVLANVERSANLFLTKTCYVLLLALAVALATVPYPQLPRHSSLTGTMSIGLPAFLLSLAPGAPRFRQGFLQRVLQFSIPAACLSAAAVLCVDAFARDVAPGNLLLHRTAATMTLGLCGLSLLGSLPNPVRRLQALLLVTMAAALVAAVAWAPARDFLALEVPPAKVAWVIAAAVLAFNVGLRGQRTRPR